MFITLVMKGRDRLRCDSTDSFSAKNAILKFECVEVLYTKDRLGANRSTVWHPNKPMSTSDSPTVF